MTSMFPVFAKLELLHEPVAENQTLPQYFSLGPICYDETVPKDSL